MANVLNKEKQEQVLALGRLGWALRRIEKATGLRRETASAYLRAAGIAVRPAGKWGRAPPNPANEVTADLGANPAEALQLSNPANEVTADSQELAQSEKSFASPFRELIEEQLARGRNAFGIYQQLVDHNGLPNLRQRWPRLNLASLPLADNSPVVAGSARTNPTVPKPAMAQL